MNNITINHFKAFSSEISIPLDKNLLLYGGNGAGKSYLFEAFRWIFKRDTLYKIMPGTTPEDKEQKINDVKESFKCKKTPEPFSIYVDDVEYEDFIQIKYEAFLLSKQTVINIKELRIS